MIPTSALASTLVEPIHGVLVADPYRCLEDRNALETEAWLREQATLHDAYFSEIPELARVRARVASLLDTEIFDQPLRTGQEYFYRYRKIGQEQPCIYTRNCVTHVERLLVDPQKQGPFCSVAIHRLSDDGAILAFEQRYGGTDAKALHFIDVKTGAILPDHLETGVLRGLAFNPIKEGFYYSHSSTDSESQHFILYHRFGDSTAKDSIVFKVNRSLFSKLVLTSKGQRFGALHVYGDPAAPRTDLYIRKQHRAEQWELVLTNQPATTGFILGKQALFAIASSNGSRTHIVAIDPNSKMQRIVVPKTGSDIEQVVIVQEHVFLRYHADTTTRIDHWMLDGRYVGTIPVPASGSVDMLPSLSDNAVSLFYSHESFGERRSITEYSITEQRVLGSMPSPQLSPSYEVATHEYSYESFDGAPIPISLVARPGNDHCRPRPALITSYGGFGVSVTPRFSVLVSIMLDLGVVFALPGIRGGSEHGSAWHEAARGRNRQVAISDFLAAAQWLCDRGITTERQLAAFGGSNSGILVAAAMTQRPTLFRAILCIAPLLDMVRYELFDRAYKWRHEYGSSADPQDFAALYAYSPYHRVRDEVNYPSTLFISGDKDQRCNSAHTRKMAARLQGRPDQINPILVDYDPERGHTAVLPLSTRIDALARRIAFLCRELGINIP